MSLCYTNSMALPLKQVAGTKLGRNNKFSMNTARGTPMSTNNPLVSQNNGFVGPVAGYSDTTKAPTEMEAIKDWRGESNRKNERVNDIKGTVGGRLIPKQQPNANTEEIQITEELEEEDYINQEEQAYLNSNPQNPNKATPRKMLGGIDFAGILMVTIIKDTLDIFIELLELVFDALVVTGFIGIFLWIVSTVADFTILLLTQGYLLLNDVPMNKKKGAIQGLTLLIEAIPFLGILPTETIGIVYMRNLVNKERKQEEEDEQRELDEQFQKEIENRKNSIRSRLSSQNNISNITSISKQQSSTKTTGKKEIGDKDQWKNMMDESNQNITKPNVEQKK